MNREQRRNRKGKRCNFPAVMKYEWPIGKWQLMCKYHAPAVKQLAQVDPSMEDVKFLDVSHPDSKTHRCTLISYND